jgi:phosphatidylinositol-3-phosphatase
MKKQKAYTKRISNIILIAFTGFLAIGIAGRRGASVPTAPVNAVSGNLDTGWVIHPDHIIFLWLENKGYNTIIGSRSAPFINSLAKRGTLFTNTYAITHPSYPNYVDFFAGQANGITTNECMDNFKLTTPNLYTILKEVGKSFAWYSEDLPKTGSKVCTFRSYVQKHNPTTIFTNVPATANKRFADFPSDYDQLENVIGITPNMDNDMHDGTVNEADRWIQKHLTSLIDWCTTHNSVFVIYFDESENNADNRIPVIALGQQVKEGYQLGTLYDHFSWTRTISAMFLAPDGWTRNLSAAKLITECWK